MWRKSMLAVVALVTAAVWADTLSVTVAAQRPSESTYLPLAVGNRWELRSPSAPDPMVLDVIGREANAFIVRWINPFVQATFRFESDGKRVTLVGLDMGQGNASMPANTVYWDFGRARGETWKSPVGVGEISDRAARVQTPAGTYSDVLEVRTVDRQGKSMYWSFAPNVGLVRWGRGRDAFLLSSFQQGARTIADRGRASAPAPAPHAETGTRVLIGLDATPHEKSGSGKSGKLRALQQAFDAGMTLLHSAPKWNEFEKSPGRFDLPDDADAIGEFADEHDLPIALNIRIVDTNQRSMPSSYQSWRFDDQRMADRLRAVIRAFPQSYKRHTRYLAIGNEVDGYLGSRRGDIAGYAQLMRLVLPTAREEFPNARFTVNFTSGVAADMNAYRAIADLVDFVSFTYYPLNADFTMRPPSDLRRDIERMLDVAADRKLYIQEIGYPSSERLNSSPRKQAEFYSAAFQVLRSHRDRINGATFLFMSDLPRAVVDSLGLYYTLPNSGNFKAYLQTLGILEASGTPKPAWDVFRREALAVKDGR
jgi:hypothetical protein